MTMVKSLKKGDRVRNHGTLVGTVMSARRERATVLVLWDALSEEHGGSKDALLWREEHRSQLLPVAG